MLQENTKSFKIGIITGLSCYVLWGLSPIYWKLLSNASYLEIYAHRIVWSLVFMAVICRLIFRLKFTQLYRDKRALLILGLAGVCIVTTWGIYIFSINSGNMIQASLGYYLNPLFAILLGVVVFKEKLTLLQKIATALAGAGVLWFIIDYGSFPWISISLALLFAVYGALKKFGSYPAMQALVVETSLTLPIGLILVGVTFFLPGREFLTFDGGAFDWLNTVLLIGAGIVTLLPLLLFAQAANRIPLTWIGFLQYVSPTITLLLGVFIYGEPFTTAHAICFSLIWIGLAIITTEMFWKLRKPRTETAP